MATKNRATAKRLVGSARKGSKKVKSSVRHLKAGGKVMKRK